MRAVARASLALAAIHQNGFDKRYSMAGDVGDRCRGLDVGLAKEVQTELGILSISLK